MANWYYAIGSQTLGPVSEDELRALARSGELTPSSYVVPEGEASWRTLGVVESEVGLSRNDAGTYRVGEDPSSTAPAPSAPPAAPTTAATTTAWDTPLDPTSGGSADASGGGWTPPADPGGANPGGGWTPPAGPASTPGGGWNPPGPGGSSSGGGWTPSGPPTSPGGWSEQAAGPYGAAAPSGQGWGEQGGSYGGAPGSAPGWGEQGGPYGGPPPSGQGWGGQPGGPGSPPAGWGGAPGAAPGPWGAPGGQWPGGGWSSDQVGGSPYAVAGGGPAGAVCAEWWQRLVAKLIDSALILIPGVVLFFALAWNDIRDQMDRNDGAFTVQTSGAGPITASILGAVIGFVYLAVLDGRGQTLGKMAMGIRVVRMDDGGVPGLNRGALRHLVQFGLQFASLHPIGSCALLIFLLVDSLWPLWDDRRQALHDKIGSTAVIKAR